MEYGTSKEVREILMSCQRGGDCVRDIIRKKFGLVGVVLGENIIKINLSMGYDRVSS